MKRAKQIRSIVHSSASLDEAVTLAESQGITLSDMERREIEDRLNHRALMQTTAAKVYYGSNGGKTRSFCSQLRKKGMLGKIAAELFMAQKASTRAKVYRGGVTTGSFRASYRDLAYERKDKAIVDLSELLVRSDGGLTWGWGRDEMNPVARNVLYVDLPHGQASFHSVHRHRGPDYTGAWDGQEKSEQRILELCNSLMAEPVVNNNEGQPLI